MTAGSIPCRLPAAYKVYTSHLPRTLRPLALALAWFADDDGRKVFPAVETLAQMMGCQERIVRAHLAALRRLGVIIPESGLAGGRRRSTLYRFDFAVLAALRPEEDPREPGTGVQGLSIENSETLLPDAEKGAAQSRKPCNGVPETLQPAAGDPLEPLGTINNAATALRAVIEVRKEQKAHAKEAEATTGCPDIEQRVSLAKDAYNEVLRRHDDRRSSVQRRYRELLQARWPGSADATLDDDAIDRAIRDRNHAKTAFFKKRLEIAPRMMAGQCQ